MEKMVLRLRICYGLGAVIDGLMVLPLLFPRLAGMLFGISNFAPGPDYRYAAGVAASLMAGWTLLLVWADRKPMERRDILLITVFPVVFGLILSGIYSVVAGLISTRNMTSTWIMQAALVIFLGSTYIQSNDIK